MSPYSYYNIFLRFFRHEQIRFNIKSTLEAVARYEGGTRSVEAALGVIQNTKKLLHYFNPLGPCELNSSRSVWFLNNPYRMRLVEKAAHLPARLWKMGFKDQAVTLAHHIALGTRSWGFQGKISRKVLPALSIFMSKALRSGPLSFNHMIGFEKWAQHDPELANKLSSHVAHNLSYYVGPHLDLKTRRSFLHLALTKSTEAGFNTIMSSLVTNHAIIYDEAGKLSATGLHLVRQGLAHCTEKNTRFEVFQALKKTVVAIMMDANSYQDAAVRKELLKLGAQMVRGALPDHPFIGKTKEAYFPFLGYMLDKAIVEKDGLALRDFISTAAFLTERKVQDLTETPWVVARPSSGSDTFQIVRKGDAFVVQNMSKRIQAMTGPDRPDLNLKGFYMTFLRPAA